MILNSPYERRENDFYATPAPVVDAVLDLLGPVKGIVLEPAAGDGAIVERMRMRGIEIESFDISPAAPDIRQADFLGCADIGGAKHVLTNPPYDRGIVDEFVKKSVDIASGSNGFAALLLPVGWTAARRRAGLFEIMTSIAHVKPRIKWMAGTDADKGLSPAADHAWHLWDFRPDGERIPKPFYHLFTDGAGK